MSKWLHWLDRGGDYLERQRLDNSDLITNQEIASKYLLWQRSIIVGC